MVRFWVGFALFIAAVATVAHYLGAPGDRVRAAFDSGRMTSAKSAEHVSSEVATQARQVGEFTRIHAEGASVIEVEVREGLAAGVEVKTDENLLPAVHTEVIAGVLEISPDAGFKPHGDLHIKVTAPALAGIHLEGANKLTLTIHSRAPIELHSEGAVRIRAAGRVDAVTMRGEGASVVDARELIARSVDVRLEGAGRATVHATERLKARIEGAGVVRYAGNPTNVDKEVDGIGHISRIE
jgi:hypothetical protein